MQASELIVPSEGATCWENVTCTAQTRDHDGTRVYVPQMKVCVCVCVCHVSLYLSLCVSQSVCRVCIHVCLCVCVCVRACVRAKQRVLHYCYQVEIKLIWVRADPDAVPMDATFIECMMGVYRPCFDKPYVSTRINNYQFNSISTMMVMGEMIALCMYHSVFIASGLFRLFL